MDMNSKQWMKMLDAIMDSNQVFFWEWQIQTYELRISQKITEFLNESYQLMDAKHLVMIEEALVEDLRKWMFENTDEVIAKGILESRELKLKVLDEEEFWVRISGKPVVSEDGESASLVGTLQNITYLKRCNEYCYGQQSFLTSLLELIPFPVFYKNREGIYEFCNERFCEYLKLTKEEIIGKTVFDIAPPELAEVYYRADQDLMRKGEIQEYESEVLSSDGKRHDVGFNKTVYKDASGVVIGLMGLVVDITKEKLEQRRMYKQEAIRELFLKISQMIGRNVDEVHLFDMLIEGLVMLFEDANYGSILEITDNKTLHSIASYGYKDKGSRLFEIPLKESYIYRLSKGDLSHPRILRDVFASEENFPENLVSVDGGPINTVFFIPVELDESSKLVLCLDSNKVDGYDEAALQIADFITIQMPIIYQVYQISQRTMEFSRHDGLTGFVKREYFQILLQDRLALAKRNGEKLLLVMMDLDGLKKVNDKYGHHAGDEYIVQYSKHISDYFRVTDIFSRIGGDEFIGLFSVMECNQLKNRLEEFQQLFTTMPIEVDEQRFYGGFSYGISIYPDDGESRNELIKIADSKMYENKRSRR
jgi:diguanylate cyclase (GGDEF)-like protein/PAS domain S-box-containing protein